MKVYSMKALVTVFWHLLVKNSWVRSHSGLNNQAFIYLKYFTRETLGCDFIHVDAASRETATWS